MSPSRRSALLTAAVSVLLALHWWLGVSGTFDKCVTIDESAHLVGGYAYWKFNDYRLQPENGNLPQRWAALPLLAEKPRLEPAEDTGAWSRSIVWVIGQRFLFESGNNTDFMLATARAAMAMWSVVCGLLVFLWSRKLWGETGGLFSLALYAFSPTTLAHGPLVTSDMTATFFLLAASGAYWRWLKNPNPGPLATSLLLTGLAAVSKFSFLLLGPAFLLLACWRWLELRNPNRPDCAVHSGRYFAKEAAVAVAHAGIVVFVIWIFYGMRYIGFAPGMPAGWKYYIPWQELVPKTGFWRLFLLQVKEWRLLPEAYLHGFAYMLELSKARSAFLFGDYGITGWWWFFPYAFLIKTSLAELGAVFLTLLLILVRWKKAFHGWLATAATHLRRVAPLVTLFAVYWFFSIISHLNIGHRHILPVYPPIFIMAGLIARPSAYRWAKATAIALACLAAIESTAVRPHHLAYFNALAGGPANGWRHLVDSSLDWGQDLPDLAKWLAQHPRSKEKIYISYFGMGDWRYEGIRAEPLSPYYQNYRLRYWTELQPGLYCIGATMLQDPYSPWSGPWKPAYEHNYRILLTTLRAELASGKRSPFIAEFGEGDSHPLWDLDRMRFARLRHYLRFRRPEAVIDYTIFVYRLDAREIQTVVDGTPVELAALMEEALRARSSH